MAWARIQDYASQNGGKLTLSPGEHRSINVDLEHE
jgi:hypothetical protein